MKKTILKKVLLGVFLAIEIIIYSLIIIDSFDIQFLDFPFANDIRFIATFMMVLFGVLLAILDNTSNKVLLLATLFFVGADGFLVLSDSFMYGIGSFIIAQLVIQIYISKSLKFSIIQATFGVLLACLYFILRNYINGLEMSVTMIGLAYGGYSIFNIVTCLIKMIKEKSYKKNICLLLALIFLFLCDICIGLSFGLNIYPFPNSDWIFYMPCLILMMIEQYVLVKEW